MPIRRAAFTLLEICLALLIGLLLVLLAVPSVSGLLAEQRLRKSFERFDRLVVEAKRRSVSEQQPWRLVWESKDIALVPVGRRTGAGDASLPERLVPARDEAFHLQRPAALRKNPPPEWVFWPDGTCEPAVIAFAGQSGKWEVRYDALTARGVFIRSETR